MNKRTNLLNTNTNTQPSILGNSMSLRNLFTWTNEPCIDIQGRDRSLG